MDISRVLKKMPKRRVSLVIQQEDGIPQIQPFLESAASGSRGISQCFCGLLHSIDNDAQYALAATMLDGYHPIRSGHRSAILQSIARGHGAGQETTQ